jgi:hypothetical protein
MNMNKLNWLVLGGLGLATAGLLTAACSSSGTTLPVGSSGNTSSGGPGVDAGKPDAPVIVNPSDAGADAAACKGALKPAPTVGPYCPFGLVAADGGTKSGACPTGETCCGGFPAASGTGFDPSLCVKGGAAACPAPTKAGNTVSAIECTEKDDCVTAGQVCCIIAKGDGGVVVAKDKNMCPATVGENGTRCKAACSAGELEGCQQNSDCSGGKTCVYAPVNVGTNSEFMGACQ